ncbi:MAG: aldehyde ferredoxin oxidoreductase family protein [Desulfobacterales bacterium]|jgi:aldehyde:ferredoxin oxidoreductase
MNGFFGKVLTINLSRQQTEIESIPETVYRRGLGGKGLAAYLLLRDNPAGVDPLDPDNRLIFATGPATGSPIWGSCRHGIFTKSPQTGFFSESYSGGTAAESMAATGFDAVVIYGAAESPVWIEISDETIDIHDAGRLWGMDTYGTEDAVKAWVRGQRPEAGRAGVVVIGPAGENRVVFSVIENDYWRSAGRTGVGAVMGAKRIKAVAFHGESKRTFADTAALRSFAKSLSTQARDDPGVKAYKTMGTPMLVDIMNKVGGFPVRYWKKGRSDHAEQINAGALHERCSVKPHACLKCLMACGRLSTVNTGRHQGLTIEGPEYETIYAFGGLCEVDQIEEIAYLNDVCDRLGLDTITGGNLAALTIEAVRQGRIEYDIDYGRVDNIARLLEDIAFRRGIGDVLACGIRTAAAHWRMEDQAIHVKGMEPAGYDPRVLKGMGLAYGTSDRGACHLRSTFYKPELAGIVDPEQMEGKAAVFAEWEDRLTIFDTLILCRFYRDLYQWEPLSEIVRGVTGLDLDVDSLRLIAAAVTNDARRFNIREGLTAKDDRIPERFFREALPETGKSILPEQMDRMLEDYYRVRGWNQDGVPPADAD